MDTKIAKKASEQAKKELEKGKVEILKNMIKDTLQAIEDKSEEVRNKSRELKALKQDLKDLEQGNINKIVERQKKDKISKKVSVIDIKVLRHDILPSLGYGSLNYGEVERKYGGVAWNTITGDINYRQAIEGTYLVQCSNGSEKPYYI